MQPPRVSLKPTYSLRVIKELTSSGNARATIRAYSWLKSHYEDPRKVIETVIAQLQPEDFWKSFELNDRPGTMADVYIGGPWPV